MRKKKSVSRRAGRRTSDAHRREIERALREFLTYAEKHPKHLFAAGTRRFLEEVRPHIEQLDATQAPNDERR